MAKEKDPKGKTNDYNKIVSKQYPSEYYTGDIYNVEGDDEFNKAVTDLDQTKLGQFNKKLKQELEKGEKVKFDLKK